MACINPFALSEHQSVVTKEDIRTVCACSCEVNKEAFSECILQSVCHRDPVSVGDTNTLAVF